MRGARYGVVVSMSRTPADKIKVEMDAIPGRIFAGHAETFRAIH